jgi:chromate reductase
MPKTVDVIALVGSLRRESYNRTLVRALQGVAPPSMTISIVEIDQLSFYNQDQETAPPQPWVDFRARIRQADAVLFATPEYNRSVPGVLKNAIDVGSRPYGQNAWAKKPAAVISLTTGVLGAFGANHHLRQCLVALDMPTLQQPEAYLSGAAKMFDPAGQFAQESLREFCSKFMNAFATWIERQLRSC